MWGGCGEEARSDFVRRRGLVEGAVKRGEEIVDIPVEGGHTESISAVFEQKGVDEGAMLSWC